MSLVLSRFFLSASSARGPASWLCAAALLGLPVMLAACGGDDAADTTPTTATDTTTDTTTTETGTTVTTEADTTATETGTETETTTANTQSVTLVAIDAHSKAGLPGVTVTLGATVVGTTNALGEVTLTLEEGKPSVAKVSMASFAPGYLPLVYTGAVDLKVSVPLTPVDFKVTVDVTQATQVVMAAGDAQFAMLDIPAGALVDANGQVVTGMVDVASSYVAPSEISPSNAPAPMVIKDNGEEIPMTSYGMIDITITKNNVPVQVAAGKTLGLDLQVTPESPVTAPLWSIDPETGLWVLEGDVSNDGDMWTAQLPHLSWFNVDTGRAGNCCVSYEAKYPNGTPAAVDIFLAFTPGGYDLFSTNASGTYQRNRYLCGSVFDVRQRTLKTVTDATGTRQVEDYHILVPTVTADTTECKAVAFTALCRDNADCPAGQACADGVCGKAGCGDGSVDAAAGEACDDHNVTNGDGCDLFCQTEVCGDGIITANEGCDDHNKAPNDGCSATCQVETGWTCSNAINLNTGSDNKGGRLANGAKDARWQWSESVDGPWTENANVLAECVGPWHDAPAYAQWVSRTANCASPDETITYYRTTFFIPNGQAAKVKLSGSYWVDDQLASAFINGKAVMADSAGAAFNTPTGAPFGTWTSEFYRDGINELVIGIRNTGTNPGTAEAANPDGFLVAVPNAFTSASTCAKADPCTPAVPDTDNDGVPDACDACPNDATLSTFNWVTWNTPITGKVVTGTVGGTTATYTSDQNLETSPQLFRYATTFGKLPQYQVPATGPVLRNTKVTTNVLKFSRSVADPLFVFSSIGSGSIAVPIEFSDDVEVVWSLGVTVTSPRIIVGKEGYAIVRVKGVHDTVTFKYTAAETWVNFVFGFGGDTTTDSDNDGTPDICDTTPGGDPCAATAPDRDNDGVADACDACPDDATLSTFNWVTWNTPISGKTATGTVGGATATYTSDLNLQTSDQLFAYDAQFGGLTEYHVPATGPVIKNTGITTNVLTFSRAVANPVFVFASIGGNNVVVPIEFSDDVEIVWSVGVTQPSPRVIVGSEGYAIVRIKGVHESVTFKYTVAENWVDFVFGFGGDTTTDSDGDGTPDVCDKDLANNVGCSDGGREGFIDTATYPNIAACSGGWSVPGLVTLSETGTINDQVDRCQNGAGDDSANGTGTGCGAEDLCATGWSVCADQAAVAAKGGATACADIGTSVSGKYMFATRQRSQGSYICDITLDPKGTNDVYGCASSDFGNALTGCGPLNRVTDDNCVGVAPATDWECNDNNTADSGSIRELADVTKVSSANGGVLCCRN